MKKRLRYLILPLVTLILEILPYGAVCNFARPSTDGEHIGHFRELYSYFDLTPFGYANFAPLITAVITCIVILVLMIYCFTGKDSLLRKAKIILAICAIVSFGPIVLGIRFFSVAGLLISLSLIAEFFVLKSATKVSDNSQ